MGEKRFFFVFLYAFLVLLLGSCKKIEKSHIESSPSIDQEFLEARLHDVPLLLRATNVRLLQDQQEHESVILHYTANFSLAEAVIFYEEHMERFGWQKLVCFESGQEVLLNYEKPQKYCSVSLRMQSERLGVVIYTSPKSS